MKDGDVYNVEKIVDSRIFYGKKQYLIKWEGYPGDFNTWEYEKDIFCKDLIAEYEASAKSRASKKDAKKKRSIEQDSPNTKVNRSKAKESTPKKETSIALEKGECNQDSWEDMIEDVITVQWNSLSKRLDVQFKMKNGNVGIVPATDAHVHFPRALIRFYEKHISFQSDSEEDQKNKS